MNFFEAQDNARKKTKQLVLLLTAAVISLIVLTNLLVAAVYLFFNGYMGHGGGSWSDALATMPPDLWAWISLAVLGVVGCASGYKYLAVQSGGRAIGELLGGAPLRYDSATPEQKRLLNVVEEMAIASGLPVPPVYLIPESSINAFAAGFTPNDAIIGINQGTIEHLNRDELQGVVAHEFSHILNGDTHINLRLIAILHGILFLGILGYIVLRGGGLRASGRKSSAGVPLLALGVGLVIIGYAGTFFGNLIKAGVSRQREYLADAAAVQFTRNPIGIANALKKIGGLTIGSTMTAPKANEVSHMFFGEANRRMFGQLLATHPPLDERIRAVEPSWDGAFTPVTMTQTPAPEQNAVDPRAMAHVDSLAVRVAEALPDAGGSAIELVDVDEVFAVDEIVGVEDRVGHPTAAHVATAHALVGGLPTALTDAAHDPWSARAITYAGLLDADETIRKSQLAHLKAHGDRGIDRETDRLYPLLSHLNAPDKLTLFEMSTPALKVLSHEQYRRFSSNLVTLIKLDQRIDLFEWVLHRLIVNNLKPHYEGAHYEGARHSRTRHRNYDGLAADVGALLCAIARYSHDSSADASAAFGAGAVEMDLALEYDASPDPNFARLNTALRALRRVSPLAKPKLLKACIRVALHDELLTFDAHALLQGVAATLDCPLPPIVSKPAA